jgi:DNA polymerase III delta prime subunit
MTCNYLDVVPDPIQSRCAVYEFRIENKQDYAMKCLEKMENICKAENLEYDKKVVVEIVKKHFPDMRSMILSLQQFSEQLTNENLKYKLLGIDVKPLIESMKAKRFEKMKEFVINELEITEQIYRKLFDNMKDYIQPKSIPAAILTIDDYMRHHTFVADTQIHVIAFLLDFSNNVEWK